MSLPIDNSNESQRADEWLDSMEDRRAIMEMLSAPRVVFLSASESYTKKHYPNTPNHRLYQNLLVSEGYSEEQRRARILVFINSADRTPMHGTFRCAGCSEEVVKKHPTQRFCKEKIKGSSTCRDFVNNFANPKRFKRTLEWLEKKNKQ